MILSNGEVYPHKGWFFLADFKLMPRPAPSASQRCFQTAKSLAARSVCQGWCRTQRLRGDTLLVSQRAVGGALQNRKCVTPENNVEIRPHPRSVNAWGHMIAEGACTGRAGDRRRAAKLKPGVTVPPCPIFRQYAVPVSNCPVPPEEQMMAKILSIVRYVAVVGFRF